MWTYTAYFCTSRRIKSLYSPLPLPFQGPSRYLSIFRHNCQIFPYRQQFLFQFKQPKLLPEMPFDIERFSIPINSPSYNEAKSFDSYISSFCVLIVTLELQPPSLLPELVSFFSFSYFPKNSQNSPRWTTCCRCNHTGWKGCRISDWPICL